ncbi:unnamed protein product [Didymodactylos carnosus]|uniref:Uncharacterized protein n=1 Tax=Didymodactylos carnosus TaxID=1234261 RepID=A0A8S2LJ22_9BILA|nr:unnamed protein product [Didymodactylos carnosus]CAF3904477.1 unnamed protein product [Didymodactylos carnosus]
MTLEGFTPEFRLEFLGSPATGGPEDSRSRLVGFFSFDRLLENFRWASRLGIYSLGSYVVDAGTVIPAVEIAAFTVVVEKCTVTTLGIIVVVDVVLNPVSVPYEALLKMVNTQNVGSVMGFDWGPQNSVPDTTPLEHNAQCYIVTVL